MSHPPSLFSTAHPVSKRWLLVTPTAARFQAAVACFRGMLPWHASVDPPYYLLSFLVRVFLFVCTRFFLYRVLCLLVESLLSQGSIFSFPLHLSSFPFGFFFFSSSPCLFDLGYLFLRLRPETRFTDPRY